MAKLRGNGMRKKPTGIVKLKIAVEKLPKISLLLGRKQESYDNYEDGFGNSRNRVPKIAKKGHFAVLAVDGDQLKRFMVPLNCLTHPRFVSLLEQAAEEYDFNYGGALAIPCSPSELERILADGGESGDPSDDGSNWGWSL